MSALHVYVFLFSAFVTLCWQFLATGENADQSALEPVNKQGKNTDPVHVCVCFASPLPTPVFMINHISEWHVKNSKLILLTNAKLC